MTKLSKEEMLQLAVADFIKNNPNAKAIAFSEWIKKHAYEYDIVKDSWTAIECKTDRNFLCETTEELYELFKKYWEQIQNNQA